MTFQENLDLYCAYFTCVDGGEQVYTVLAKVLAFIEILNSLCTGCSEQDNMTTDIIGVYYLKV